MVSRQMRKHRQMQGRKYAEKRYEKHRRHNLAYAQPGENDFIIVLDNLKPSFNIGKIFRSADAFGANSVHLVGTDFFEVKSAKGSFKWVPARFHDDFESCFEILKKDGYTFFTLEPDADGSLSTVTLPPKSAFIFGHEEFGISFNKNDFDNISSISIPQTGRVESLNVSVAASIVMYEYIRQMSQNT